MLLLQKLPEGKEHARDLFHISLETKDSMKLLCEVKREGQNNLI